MASGNPGAVHVTLATESTMAIELIQYISL
jgi:hypothetical protein